MLLCEQHSVIGLDVDILLLASYLDENILWDLACSAVKVFSVGIACNKR